MTDWRAYIDTALDLIEEIGVGKMSDADCKAMLRMILLANRHRKAAAVALSAVDESPIEVDEPADHVAQPPEMVDEQPSAEIRQPEARPHLSENTGQPAADPPSPSAVEQSLGALHDAAGRYGDPRGWVWTPARDDLLRLRWPSYMVKADIHAELAKLPGHVGGTGAVVTRAALLGVNRPKDFASHLGKIGGDKAWAGHHAKAAAPPEEITPEPAVEAELTPAPAVEEINPIKLAPAPVQQRIAPVRSPKPSPEELEERRRETRRLMALRDEIIRRDWPLGVGEGTIVSNIRDLWPTCTVTARDLKNLARFLKVERPASVPAPATGPAAQKPAPAKANGHAGPVIADFQQIEHWAAARGMEFTGDNLEEVNSRRSRLGLVEFSLKMGPGWRG